MAWNIVYSPAIGGSLADGATYVMAGSGFGTRSTSSEFLGGLGGFIDSLATDAEPITNLGSTLANWTALQSATGRYPYGTSERAWSRNKSYAYDVRSSTGPSGEYKQSQFFDTGSGGFTRMYTNAIINLTYDVLLTGSYLQWKMIRWYNAADVEDGTIANGYRGYYLTQQIRSVGPSDTLFTGFQNNGGTIVQATVYPQSFPQRESGWYRYETWVRQNSAAGVADGYFRVRVTDATTGAVYADSAYTNIIFNGSSNDLLFRYLVLQNYFGNASDGGYPQPDNANACAWWDDTAVQYGSSDDAFKICYLTDASTWAASSIKEFQPVSSWTDTAITFTINKGAHADLNGKYIHLFSGTPSTQIGSGIPLL